MAIKKAILIVSIIFTIVLMMSGCNPFLPVYKRTDTNGVKDKDGISIIIDGIRYKMFPATRWEEIHPGKLIGYAGSWKTTVQEVEGDSDRNFVILHDVGSDPYYTPLYRTDKTIPDPSADTIDRLEWIDYTIGQNNDYTNTVRDKIMIRAVFDVLSTGYKFESFNHIEKNSEAIVMHISCYSSEVPGAKYIINIGTNSEKIVCGNSKDGYVEVPVELLEKIAGKSLPF